MSRKLLPFLFAFLLLGAAVGCSSSEDDAGDDEGTTTTAEDSGSEDEGGDEGEEEGEDEGDDGETDKAEAALEEITKNFGITKKSRWLGRPPGRDEMIAVAVGAWSPWFLGASSPSKVWCGIRGTGECRFEHEPQILNRPWFPSDGR